MTTQAKPKPTKQLRERAILAIGTFFSVFVLGNLVALAIGYVSNDMNFMYVLEPAVIFAAILACFFPTSLEQT